MKTEIIFINDRSGSMETMRDDVIGGFNNFIEEQKKLPGEARVSLVTFNNHVHPEYTAVPIDKVEPLSRATFIPMMSTALHDAICMTLMRQGMRIGLENWADKVIVVIITDGQENASRSYTLENVRWFIEHCEKFNWHFVYLGANQDAFHEALNLGITSKMVRNFEASAAGAAMAYGATSAMVSQLRTAP